MALSTEAALRKDTRPSVPNMQHRHFAFIAQSIASLPDTVNRLTVARHMANELAATNDRFDRPRFLAACRPE